MKYHSVRATFRNPPGFVALLVVFVFIAPGISALSPEDLSSVAGVIRADDPEAVILEIDMESSGRGGIVTVETNRAIEYYIGLASPEILERERRGRMNARLARRVAAVPDTMNLPDAYRLVLEYLAQNDRYSRVSPGDFSSIEYQIEFGRLIVEVIFDGVFGDLSVYMDPVTGEILESEWDD
ncbi:MAG: hypothetical protein ACOCU4_10865 [Alkalispirochaeta sp.]